MKNLLLRQYAEQYRCMMTKKMAPIDIRAVSIQYSMKISCVYFKFSAKAYHSLLNAFW